MKNLTLLFLLLTGMIPVTNAHTVPVKVSFKMVNCGFFIERCAKTKIAMNDEIYQALGEPDFAQLSYYKDASDVFSFLTPLTPGPFGDIIVEADSKQHQPYGLDKNELFTITKVCLDKNCIKYEIESSADEKSYAYQTLHFPALGSTEQPAARIGFKKIESDCYKPWYSANRICDSIYSRAKIEMSSKSSQALAWPKLVTYYYKKRVKTPLFTAKFVSNNQGQWYFVKTDIDNKSNPTLHHSFMLNRVCLDKVGCLDVNIKDTSSKGDYIEKTLYFTVTDDIG